MKNQWILLLFCVMVLGLVQAVVGDSSEENPSRDYVAVYNDGDTKPGVWYVNRINTWGKVYEDAEKFDAILLHNPGGRFGPNVPGGPPYMALNQFTLTTAQAKADPDNKDLQAKADWDALIEASIKRTKEEIWYLGGTKYFPKKNPSETDRSFVTRIMREEWGPVFLARPDEVVLDAETYVNPPSHSKLLIAKLLAYGMKVSIEPYCYANKQNKYYRDKVGVMLQTELLERRLFGHSGWDTGKFKKEPLWPVFNHERRYELVKGADAEAEAAVARSRGMRPCVNLLKIPKSWYEPSKN